MAGGKRISEYFKVSVNKVQWLLFTVCHFSNIMLIDVKSSALIIVISGISRLQPEL